MAPPEIDNLSLKRLFYQFIKSRCGVDFYSQAMQDVFCLCMNDFKTVGSYLEVGAGSPRDSSNSFLLESQFSWKGISVEQNPTLVEIFSAERQNKCIHADATAIDYQRLLDENDLPSQLDYLSIDIDPPSNTYEALVRCLDSRRRFSVITYEHDKYSHGDRFMLLSRQLLSSRGYSRVVGCVKVFGREFEDWWVDSTIIPEDKWYPYSADSAEFMQLPIFQKLYSNAR